MKIFDLDIGIGQSHLTCQQKPVCIYSLIYYIKICELHCKFKDVKFDNEFSLCFISLHFRVWLHIVQEQKWSFVLSSREYSQKLLQQSVPFLPKMEQKKKQQESARNIKLKQRGQKRSCLQWRNLDQVGKSVRWADNCCWHPSSDTNPGWGRRKRSVSVRGPGGGCCPMVRVSASGAAARVQWDRLGLYRATGDIHNGRPGHTFTGLHFTTFVRKCAMHNAESPWQCCWPRSQDGLSDDQLQPEAVLHDWPVWRLALGA